MDPGGRMACETMMIMKEIKVSAIDATRLTGLTAMIRKGATTVMKKMMIDMA
jgi:hypothetical protein